MKYLEFDNVGLKFGEKAIFSGLSFSVASGEKVLLKGRSGVGKSSVFEMIMGFLKPNCGNIRFKGQQLSQISIQEYRRNISWIPQNINLFPETSVMEGINLLFDMKYMKTKKPSQDEIYRIAKIMFLSPDLLNKPSKTLSGGELQRVAVLKALLSKRQLTLADEPTSAIDSATGKLVMSELLGGTDTLICISHSNEFDFLFDAVIHIGGKNAAK